MLYDSCKNIVMDPVGYTMKEITHMNQALAKYEYQADKKPAEPKKKRANKKDQVVTKNSITIPHVKSLSEVLSHVFHCYDIATTMMPH